VSDAAEPPAGDWFGGAPDAAPHGPRAVGEAFGHLRKKGAPAAEAAVGDSDWFGGRRTDASEDLVAPHTDGSASPAAGLVVHRADALPDLAATSEPSSEPSSESSPEPSSEPSPEAISTTTPEDGRVRLRALTGGLADLSDALAAIGVESVAVRTVPPAAPADAAPRAADFRVRCPDCGPQYVAIADLRFVETGDGAEANRYLFTCPACGARVRRPAGPELAEILRSSGVATLALRRGPGQAL
jgi:hypothetical protein